MTGIAVTKRWSIGIAVLVAAALALRASALDFGLPAVYNPDEVAIMSRALAFAKGDLNPHNFLYPTFFFYALFAWIGGTSSWRASPATSLRSAPFSNASSSTRRVSIWPGERSVR